VARDRNLTLGATLQTHAEELETLIPLKLLKEELSEVESLLCQLLVKDSHGKSVLP
jgi:hypothetical protein